MRTAMHRVTVWVPPTAGTLTAALEGLVAINTLLLKRMKLPPLYRAGVVYRREGRGREDWRTVLDVIRDGYGDCEDLAGWRAAELRAYRGERALGWVYPTRPGRWHAIVKRGDGTFEDPSKVLLWIERRHGKPFRSSIGRSAPTVREVGLARSRCS